MKNPLKDARELFGKKVGEDYSFGIIGFEDTYFLIDLLKNYEEIRKNYDESIFYQIIGSPGSDYYPKESTLYDDEVEFLIKIYDECKINSYISEDKIDENANTFRKFINTNFLFPHKLNDQLVYVLCRDFDELFVRIHKASDLKKLINDGIYLM